MTTVTRNDDDLQRIRMALAEAGYDQRTRNLVNLTEVDDTDDVVNFPSWVTTRDAWMAVALTGKGRTCWACAADQLETDQVATPCEHEIDPFA